MTSTELFTTQTAGSTLTIEVHGTISSLADDEALRKLDHILEQLQSGGVRNVLIDFRQSPYFGSCMLETLRRIWNDVQPRGGRLVLCNLSPVGREILQLAKFDQLWPVLDTREEAEGLLDSKC